MSSEHVLTPRPAAMIATLRRRPAACRVVDGVEDLGAAVPRAVPSGGSGHSPPEEPARRKRRNSLMAVKQEPRDKQGRCVSCRLHKRQHLPKPQ